MRTRSRLLALCGATLSLSGAHQVAPPLTFSLQNDGYDVAAEGDFVRVAGRDVAAGASFRLGSVTAPDGQRVVLAEPDSRLGPQDVEISRGAVTELYVLGERSVEQAFVVAGAPSARRGEVTLRLDVRGLEPRLEAADQVALVDDEGTTRLRYGVVRVRDRDGRILPSRVDAERGGIALRYDDRDAVYPVVVDPAVWKVTVDLTAQNPQVTAGFGRAIATDGDVLVVGEPQYDGSTGASQGAAHVFRRGATQWTYVTQLMPNPAAIGVEFGSSVDVDVVGQRVRVVVGAPTGSSTTGLAYVFEDSGTGTFMQIAQLVPTLTGIANADKFGAAVAIDGDIIVAGAPNLGSLSSGGAEVFVKPGIGNFASRAFLTPSVASASSDRFGAAVAIAGDTIVVGAPGAAFTQGTTYNGFGAAYVFTTSDQMSWTEAQKLPTAITSPADSARFGAALAFDGTSLIVGAPDFLRAGNMLAGMAFVYDAPTFTGVAELGALTATAFANFGASVAVAGDTYVVGEPRGATTGMVGGVGTVFTRNGTVFDGGLAASWEGAAVLDDLLGTSVALADAGTGAGTEVLMGAPGRRANGLVGAGTVGVATFGAALGDACTDSSECAQGNCVDEVCCNNACAGGTTDCFACSVAAGGPADGMCGMRTVPACMTDTGGATNGGTTAGGPQFSDPRAMSCSASHGTRSPAGLAVWLFGLVAALGFRRARR